MMKILSLSAIGFALTTLAPAWSAGDSGIPAGFATMNKEQLLDVVASLLEKDPKKASWSTDAAIDLVNKDPRIPQAQKPQMAQALAGTIDRQKIKFTVRALWNETFTEQEIRDLAAMYLSPLFMKAQAESQKEKDAIREVIHNEIRRNYESVTHLAYQEEPPPQPKAAPKPAAEPDWLTKMIWQLYPASKNCAGN